MGGPPVSVRRKVRGAPGLRGETIQVWEKLAKKKDQQNQGDPLGESAGGKKSWGKEKVGRYYEW